MKLFIGLLFVLILSTACTDTPESTLRIGTNVWPGYEPLYLARNKGWLNEDKVKLVELSSASQIIQTYRNHLIDAAALTLDEVLLLLESGEKIKIILVMDVSNGGDAIIGQSNITSMKELYGKSVGVENNALGAYVFTRAMEVKKLNRNKIKVVQLDLNEHEYAFLQKKVDAVVTFEPVRSKLLKSGGNLLFDSRQLADEIVDVLIIREESISAHSDAIKHLLKAWFKSLDYMQQQPSKAAEVLGLRMKLSVDETLLAYTGLRLPNRQENKYFLEGTPEPKLLLSLTKLERLMIDRQILKRNVNTKSLFLKFSNHKN